MKIRHTLAGVMVALLILVNVWAAETIEVKNATEAVAACFSYLKKHYAQFRPDAAMKIQEKTIYSGGPVDLVTTSKQFASDSWSIEVSQSFAPLRNIVYQVTVFNPNLGWYWEGSVKADGSVTEITEFKQLSEEEKQRTAEEFTRKSRIPPPQGGYGH